jgi:hypothetical protein
MHVLCCSQQAVTYRDVVLRFCSTQDYAPYLHGVSEILLAMPPWQQCPQYLATQSEAAALHRDQHARYCCCCCCCCCCSTSSSCIALVALNPPAQAAAPSCTCACCAVSLLACTRTLLHEVFKVALPGCPARSRMALLAHTLQHCTLTRCPACSPVVLHVYSHVASMLLVMPPYHSTTPHPLKRHLMLRTRGLACWYATHNTACTCTDLTHGSVPYAPGLNGRGGQLDECTCSAGLTVRVAAPQFGGVLQGLAQRAAKDTALLGEVAKKAAADTMLLAGQGAKAVQNMNAGANKPAPSKP